MILSAILLSTQVALTTDLDRAVEDGIRTGVYPGAVVVVGTRDSVLFARGYGSFAWANSSRVPSPDSTWFDLASLTKVVATTPSIMLLAQRGALDLDEPVQRYLPDFQGDAKDMVTVRHLLEHRSGLRAFLPLNTETATAEEARQRVVDEPLRWEPGTRVEYSDLNGMLLGWVVESVADEPLDQFAGRELFAPLEMHATVFRLDPSARERIMPVGLWRGHAIAGELHDQNAVRLGGVSGHAGLYSTGSDIARYARLMLNQGSLDGQRLFRAGVVLHFTRRGAGNRALGWEVRDTTSTDNTGRSMSSNTYGHTGYTGTSVWIDPDRDVFVVFLTNRVFAPRARGSISRLKRIRGAVADAAVALRRSY